jgi:hypothetical protein
MADLRLIAAAALPAIAALAGCGSAGAAPDQVSGLTPPAGWQALPAIATAARAAIGPGVEVSGAEAWGEPAMGCYAVWLAIRTDGGATAVAEQVVAGFAAAATAGSGSGAPLTIKDVTSPSGDEGVLALAFERGDHRGRLRARLGGGKIAALACFANPREPAACEAACSAFLGALP